MKSLVLDDLAEAVGYTATRTLLAWFAGRQLYVPARADRGHPLWVLLGGQAFARLVDAYGSLQLKIPRESHESDYHRMRAVAERLAGGASIDALAGELRLSVRRVQMMRRDLTDRGWLDYAAGRKAAPRLVTENLGTGGVSAEPPPPSRVG